MSGGNYKPIMDKKDNAQNDDIFQDKRERLQQCRA